MQCVQHSLSQQSLNCCIHYIGSIHSHINEQSLPTHPPSWIKVHHVLHTGICNKIKVCNISNMNDLTSYYATATGHTYKLSKEKSTQPVTLEDHKIIYQLKRRAQKFDPKVITFICVCQNP